MMKHYLPDVSLVSPLHDPEARLAQLIRSHGKELMRMYFGYVGVRTTKSTHKETLKALDSARIIYTVQTVKPGHPTMGKTYQESVKMGIKFNTRTIHVCDFDRALHWVKKYPNELRDIIELLSSNFGLTWIGRTKRAFNTHPLTQKTTEGIVNELASDIANQKLDIMSGSFAMDKKTAKSLLRYSKRQDFSFYAELLVIAIKKQIPLNSIIVDGLEWETPDQYADKIQKEGYNDWLDEFMSLPEWKRRIELLEKNIEVLKESN